VGGVTPSNPTLYSQINDMKRSGILLLVSTSTRVRVFPV
jgi:hypothetical protein